MRKPLRWICPRCGWKNVIHRWRCRRCRIKCGFTRRAAIATVLPLDPTLN